MVEAKNDKEYLIAEQTIIDWFTVEHGLIEEATLRVLNRISDPQAELSVVFASWADTLLSV